MQSHLDDLLSGIGRGWLRALAVRVRRPGIVHRRHAVETWSTSGTGAGDLLRRLAPVLHGRTHHWQPDPTGPAAVAAGNRPHVRGGRSAGGARWATPCPPALGRQLEATLARLGPMSLALAETSQELEQAVNAWLAGRSVPLRLDVAAQLTPEGLLGEAQRGIQAASVGAFQAVTVVAGVAATSGSCCSCRCSSSSAVDG